MIVDEFRFVRRYSFLYTIIVAIILISPLYVYMDHKFHVQEIKTEIELKGVQSRIIDAMNDFGYTKEKTFRFPTFSTYKSGLYTQNYQTIYTQIEQPVHIYSPGYHQDNEGNRYLITALPSQKYFGASYLISMTRISYASIMLDGSLLAFGIVSLILLLSFYFLKSFSRPFKRVNEKLDMFIKDSMHEINTPLSIINVNIDLFDAKYGKNKYFNRIKSATKALSTIYNDMDYLIKQDRIEYPDEPIHLEAFIQERVDYFELIAELKDIKLNFKSSTTTQILMNPTKLKRVVDNNLSNSIKFSNKHDTIDIEIKRCDNDAVELCFIDYGNGIENPQEVFNRYYREKDHKTGFGIGLDIVRTICEDYHIEIDVQSKRNVQTSFCYMFPKSMMDKNINTTSDS